MLGSMFVGILIGILASALANRGEHMGCIGKMFLGLCGAWLGQIAFGTWGPQLFGTALVPSVLGAIIILALFWQRGS